ncbi:UNVERIFIED_CONTAM: hypothetical protein FKN15_038218 [Acipenser sinensis]
MASRVTTAGGFAIVTHAYPLNSAGQAAPGTVASQLPGPMQTFLRGQPKALGVKVCLGMNVVSSVFAGVGSILYSITVAVASFHMDYRSAEYEYLRRYSLTIYVGILAVLLVLNILEMCIAIATSAFGCKSECSYIAMIRSNKRRSRVSEGAQEAAVREAEGAQDAAVREAEGAQDAAVMEAEGSQDAAVREAEGAQDAAVREAKGAQDAAVREAEGAQE